MSHKTILVELPATLSEASKTIKHALEYDPTSSPFLPNLSEYEAQLLQDCISGTLFEKIAKAVNYLDIDVANEANLLLVIKALAAKIDKMSAADLRKSSYSIDTLQLVAPYTHFGNAANFVYWYKKGSSDKFNYDLANLQNCELIWQGRNIKIAVGEDNILAFIAGGFLHVMDLNTRKILYGCEVDISSIVSVSKKSVITHNYGADIIMEHFFYNHSSRMLQSGPRILCREKNGYVIINGYVDDGKLIMHDDNIFEIQKRYTNFATNNKFFCFWSNDSKDGYDIQLFDSKTNKIWSQHSNENMIIAAQFHANHLYYLSCKGILFSFNLDTNIISQRIIINYLNGIFLCYYETPYSNIICCAPNNILDLETGMIQKINIQFIIGSYIINSDDIIHILSRSKIKRPSNIKLTKGMHVDAEDRVIAYDNDSQSIVLFSLRTGDIIRKISSNISSSDCQIIVSGNNRFVALLEENHLSLLS